jgi:hypothetical protein
MVSSAIIVIREEATTTSDEWLEAWKTVLHHFCDSDDELGLRMKTLTAAVMLFGSAVESKVSAGNSAPESISTRMESNRERS